MSRVLPTLRIEFDYQDDEWTVAGEVYVACDSKDRWGRWQPTVEDFSMERSAFDYEYFEEMDEPRMEEWAERALDDQRARILASLEWAELVADAERRWGVRL